MFSVEQLQDFLVNRSCWTCREGDTGMEQEAAKTRVLVAWGMWRCHLPAILLQDEGNEDMQSRASP